MQGVSRESLAAARERLDQVLTGDVDAAALSEDLFGVVRLLDDNVALRRALTDPAASAERKQGLIRELFGGKLSDPAITVVGELAGARWSRARDLADAVEMLAVQGALAAAERAGQLDELEDELFRFSRIVAGNPELRGVLADRTVPGDRKAALVGELLIDRVKPSTLRLIEQVVTQPRGRTLEVGLEEYARLAAETRQRLVAVVRVAVPLTDQERDRLAAALHRIYGREVHLNVEVDPRVVGGIRIQIGSEVIDGTVVTRLEQARSRLIG